jgi:hypothetical protein
MLRLKYRAALLALDALLWLDRGPLHRLAWPAVLWLLPHAYDLAVAADGGYEPMGEGRDAPW